MMKKTLIYILLLGLPLTGNQYITAQELSYQQKINLLDQENQALGFDSDLKLSDAESVLDKKLFQLRKEFLTETEKQKSHCIIALSTR